MVAVLMVQTTVYNVIHMVAVRHSFVSTTFAVNVSRAIMHRMATIGIGVVYIQTVFVVMTVVRVVQMTVVQIIHMVAVADGGVSAAFAVNVFVVLMGVAMAHDAAPKVCLQETPS